MIALIDKTLNKVLGYFDRLDVLEDYVQANGLSSADLLKCEEIHMKYVSRITHVDGVCIYNNTKFWRKDFTELINNYDAHTVIDILGNTIDKTRFTVEWYSNCNRIAILDGQPGQIEYNIEIGTEFISLFREECINTDFDYSTGVSPLTIWAKMEHAQIPKSIFTHDTSAQGSIDVNIISMINAGCFREAAQALSFVTPDVFLTEERIQKYMDMLNSADAITYATDKDYYYSETSDGEINETSNI